MLDFKTAQTILDRHRLGKLTSLKKHDTGITGSVFEMNENYILKMQMDAEDNLRLERNEWACRILGRHGIKAPEVVAVNMTKDALPSKYIIMSKIEGDNLSDVWKKLPEDMQRKVFFDYGRLMAQFHDIRMDRFGDPVDTARQSDDWHDCIKAIYINFYCYIGKHNILPKGILQRVNDFFKENDGLLHIKTKPVLIHNDFQAKNIKYLDGELNGIFDFDECLGAHNEMDFKKVCMPFKSEKVWLSEIMKGYRSAGTISNGFKERIKLYELNFCLKVMVFVHSNNLAINSMRDKYIGVIDNILTKEWDFFEPSDQSNPSDHIIRLKKT